MPWIGRSRRLAWPASLSSPTKEFAHALHESRTYPLALAVGLVAVAPAAGRRQGAGQGEGLRRPAIELTYPSLVRVRVARTERALERATRKIENNKPVEAATTLKVVRRQMAAAWRGAKYVIRTDAAAAPPEEDARARQAGDPPTGPTYASPPETAFRVLTLQHDVSSAMVALIDGSHGTGLDALGHHAQPRQRPP